ncbi:hypothetical protein MNEG_5977 [Monoraphidium neglectum]|uniref:Uncharacterized protein n=1 Tax=Monoraphidium neglectum TaxID=145388 RepID=A0A0D2MN37_9CHLO|nr:hypothetical protein MNEG_5977 [Monoraphidium neglectum]KIZ01982.1 hypothetical protein MNEG_5977 [Monoraphidium neglectum]|eukprot:XP_013901001.1 hypothetical protein MNEG_5977 [Monoraphidium neglectum]
MLLVRTEALLVEARLRQLEGRTQAGDSGKPRGKPDTPKYDKSRQGAVAALASTPKAYNADADVAEVPKKKKKKEGEETPAAEDGSSKKEKKKKRKAEDDEEAPAAAVNGGGDEEEPAKKKKKKDKKEKKEK